MRCLQRRDRAILMSLSAIALVCAMHARVYAQDMSADKPPVRIQFVSALPEALTYYDEGFGDFIRESKEVKVTLISVSSLTKEAIVQAAASRGIRLAWVAPPTATSTQDSSTPSNEDVKQLVSRLPNQSEVDALVVVSPGTVRSERFIKGMAVMTKIGLLGIEKTTIIFTMPQVDIYTRASARPCLTLDHVRSKRIPAIYAKWSTDMVNGPSEALHREMQNIISQELPLTIEESVAERARKLPDCLQATTQ